MAKKIEYYDGRPILEANNSAKLIEAVEKFKMTNPDILLETPYVVRVKGKKIKDCAFYRCPDICVAILNDNVEMIDRGAFMSCTSLTNVVIPDSVTEIDKYAFWGCCRLKEIYINNQKLLKKVNFDQKPQILPL